ECQVVQCGSHGRELVRACLWYRVDDAGARPLCQCWCCVCGARYTWGESLLSLPGKIWFWSSDGNQPPGGDGILSNADQQPEAMVTQRFDTPGFWAEHLCDTAAGGDGIRSDCEWWGDDALVPGVCYQQ